MKKGKNINIRRGTTPKNQKLKANKQTYSCLCKPVEKFSSKWDENKAKVSLEWLKLCPIIAAYAKSDHSDIGEHYHVFDP